MTRLITSIYVVLAVCLSPAAWTHEVHASSVTITVEGSRLEVLQTTPKATAMTIAGKVRGHGGPVRELDEVLATIAERWSVRTGDAACAVSRMAYRELDHASEMQMRLLFECGALGPPERLGAAWLPAAPEDHFIILELTIAGKTETVVFSGQELVLDLTTPQGSSGS